MLRKNNGSILVVTVFVFLLINIIAINCSAMVMSNIKYTKYNYEEMYLEEQCLSKIEVVYSNILKEVEVALDNSSDFDSFESYFISNNSADFINNINDLSGVSLNNKKCKINKINRDSQDYLYYKIESTVSYNKFIKTMVAYVKIKNPFDKNEALSEEKLQDTSDSITSEQIEDLEDILNKIEDNYQIYENNQIESNKNEETEELNTGELKLNQNQGSNIEKSNENKSAEEDNKKSIKPSDLVTVYDCKEV